MANYFHQLSDLEFETLKDSGISWGEVMEKYSQPDWCNYPDALEGMMGCWSLVSRLIVNEDSCKNCDQYSSDKSLGCSNEPLEKKDGK